MHNQKMKFAWLVLLGGIGIGACQGETPSDSGASSSVLSSASSVSSASSSGMGGSGGGSGGVNCFLDPMTHIEIINACNDAEKVDKVVTLPLLNPDGTLPPLP